MAISFTSCWREKIEFFQRGCPRTIALGLMDGRNFASQLRGIYGADSDSAEMRGGDGGLAV